MPYRGPIILTVDEVDLLLDGLPPPGSNPLATSLRTRMTDFLQDLRRNPEQPTPTPKPTTRDKDGYVVPSLTVDAAVVRGAGADLELLLVTRGREPDLGKLAFPGGFVDYGEDPEAAVLRELREECGVVGSGAELVAVRGAPGRDPRKHIVTVCYYVRVEEGAAVEAGDDAAQCGWYSMEALLKDDGRLAFDHGQLLRQVAAFIERAGGR